MAVTKKLVSNVRVKNEQGLHTRPATYIVKLLQSSKSQVFFTYKHQTVNPTSVLNILLLAAHKNANIKITVDGEDAEETMHKLLNAFEMKFGE